MQHRLLFALDIVKNSLFYGTAELEIQKLLSESIEKRQERTEITADRVIAELAKLAFFDIRKMFDDEGKPKDISILDDTTACIVGINVQDSFEYDGDKKVFNGYIKKYKLADKRASLESLGQHLGIFNDKLQINGDIAISETAKVIDERIKEFTSKHKQGD